MCIMCKNWEDVLICLMRTSRDFHGTDCSGIPSHKGVYSVTSSKQDPSV